MDAAAEVAATGRRNAGDERIKNLAEPALLPFVEVVIDKGGL
jgi:hypothetical protein